MAGMRNALGRAAVLTCLALPSQAGAQEVLFLRIRPQPDPAALGAGGGAEAERAAREAAWERSNQRARRIIESVCTGCLGPWVPPVSRVVASAAALEIPGPRGLDTDRPREASEPTFDPAIPERRP
jgi:hypothetical protein